MALIGFYIKEWGSSLDNNRLGGTCLRGRIFTFDEYAELLDIPWVSVSHVLILRRYGRTQVYRRPAAWLIEFTDVNTIRYSIPTSKE